VTGVQTCALPILSNKGKWGVVDVKDAIVLFQKDAQDQVSLYKILTQEPVPSQKRSVVIDQQIEFSGFDFRQEPPQSLHLTSYWKSLNETQKDFNIFIDLIDENGRTVSRTMRPLCYRIYPTNAWVKGQWIADESYVTLPLGLAPGRYSLWLGFFDFNTKQAYLANPRDPLGRVFIAEFEHL
jgi:hypothetical protein